jgi:hypothetical protein
VSGQLVYIQDDKNFCINLPNPEDPFLIANYYSKGKYPTIVGAEGYVRCFCVGSYIAPGCLAMPAGGYIFFIYYIRLEFYLKKNVLSVTAAHALRDLTNASAQYYQVTGRLDCNVLKIDCSGDNSGQCKFLTPFIFF